MDPVMVALRLVALILGLALLTLGIRVAVSRRIPRAWIRVARLTARQQAQPVGMGIGQALVGASLLVQQAPFLFSVPYPVGVALLAVSLLLFLIALGLFARRPRPGTKRPTLAA